MQFAGILRHVAHHERVGVRLSAGRDRRRTNDLAPSHRSLKIAAAGHAGAAADVVLPAWTRSRIAEMPGPLVERLMVEGEALDHPAADRLLFDTAGTD